jgi:3-phosphoshikimate 1-carboxyvinyltransferase
MALPDPYPVRPLSGPFELTLDDLPGSKSLTNRALLIAALAEGTSRLSNVLFAEDTRVMLAALEGLGFTLRVDEASRAVEVEGRGGRIPKDEATLDLGNAGTAMRFLTAACCLGAGTYVLDGVERMRQRPIGQLIDALRELGAAIEYLGEEGYPPLRIRAAGLEGGPITLSTMLSSQYVSALILAGPLMREGLRITTEGPETSRPYVEMTHHMVSRFTGIPTVAGPEGQITLSYEPTGYRAGAYPVEPDASNAGYFLAATAVEPMSTCRIDGLGRGSLQGDAGFAHVLGRMGATAQQLDRQTWIKGPRGLQGIEVDLNAMPDMAQTLAVAALFAEGETVIRDVGTSG